ncbi:HAD-IA family hydrolase [Chloroflexota bacterium]
MVNPNDVNLLIFDMDGTIVQSDLAQFQAIKKALNQLGLECTITYADVKIHLGEPSEEFYRNIMPQELLQYWQQVRNTARELYDSVFRDFGSVFHRAKDTLDILRRRGYKLALHSNTSTEYFNSAISALNIRDYFDYIECVQDNNLTKPELVQKIKKKLGNPETAVIGDRIYDIETARENGALSVGALYGYGGKEPEQADITIKELSDLLDIFDRKLVIFEKILEEILMRKHKNKAFVVGITGIDVSGKTKFAESLAMFLISKDYRPQIINLDDFHNPQKVRYSGEDQAENYYNRSFDINTIVERLLIPIHQKSKHSIKLTLLDLHTDKYEVEKEFSFDQNTIVLFEGVFLFRQELSPYTDYKIFLEIPFEESKNRAAVRDVPIYGKEMLRKYDEKYLPAQRKYLDEFPASKTVDMVIDNSNWEYPRIKHLH